MTGLLVGSDEQNVAKVEAAIGRKVDVVRAYRWKGANHASLRDLAAAGYGVWASYAYRDNAGTVIPAATIPSHAIDADLDLFDQAMEGLNRVGVRGPHRKVYRHEEDGKTAAASGSIDALNAAQVYCIGRRKAQAVAVGLKTFTCWTGFDLLRREIPLRVSGLAGDGFMLDPYELAGAGGWPSLVASYGQDFNYLQAVYPGKPICLGEVNAPNTAGPGRQAAWLNQARADLEAQFPAVDGACLWQGGNLQETPAELALMRAGFFAPPAPATVAVDARQLASLKAIAAGL